MRKSARTISLIALSMIFLAGFLAAEVGKVREPANVSTPTSGGLFPGPGFDGARFSTAGSPRAVNEYLFGTKLATQHTILSGGSDILSLDIPIGWSPMDLSAGIYQLSANQSFSRNSQFSDTYSLGGRTYPSYWTNRTTDPINLVPQWNITQEVYIGIINSGGIEVSDSASWSQQVRVNGTNRIQAKLVFDIKKSGDLGPGNDGKTYANASINGARVFSSQYASLSTSYNKQIIDVTNKIPSLSNPVNITLFLWFSNALQGSNKGYVYFDDVYLYVNCTVAPQSVALQLSGAAVLGRQDGTGNVHLQGSLTNPFTFTSNTTGRIHFKCNSAIGIYRGRPSDSVVFIATQGSSVNNNVSKATFLNGSGGSWWSGSTSYDRDILNISIPRDWTYESVILPNGTVVVGQSTGHIQKYENGSYSWIVRINATSIGRYGPNPYIIRATSINCLSTISTFRKITGDWVPGDFFVNGSRIMINATILGGGASQGSAYVVFYNASDYSVWRNMSTYAVTPGSNGVASFNFAWSIINATKSDLVTLVVWSNSSEVGVKWVPISFDLVPPKPSISSPSAGQYVKGMTDVTVSSMDANPYNMTLYIDGNPVYTWSSTSAVYSWNTTKYPEGNIELKLTCRDQVDHVNTTTLIVAIDNTHPSLMANFPLSGSYVHRQILLTATCIDANLKNVSLYINGDLVLASDGEIYYNWETTKYDLGENILAVRGWDLAGNLNESTSKVYVDNVAPTLRISLANATNFVGGATIIYISCTDTYYKNLTLLINGAERGTWSVGNPSYPWDTHAYVDGACTLNVTAWDLAGNNRTLVQVVYVDNTGPMSPGLVYPNNGEVFNQTTLGLPLSWSLASDAGVGVDYYILQLDTLSSFDSPNLRTISSLSVTNYTIPSGSPLSNGTWFWRVSAVDRLGNIGGFSPTRSFQVFAAAPGALPLALIVSLVGAIPAIAVLSSVILLKRRREERGTYDKSNLIAAYIFSSDGRALFTHQFKEVRVEPQLVSGFLSAITEMMREVIGGDRRPLRTIERSDAKIILEFGTMVNGALVTKEASREYRRRLRAFISRFEDDYADRIPKWDGDQSIFQSAPESIEEVFSEKTKVTTYPTITGLEDLLFSEKLGGVAISVEGKTGSGKTEFCLRYVSSLLGRGKPVIVVAASLAPRDVRKGLKNNNVDIEKVEKAGDLNIYDAYSEISGLKSDEKIRFGSPGELNKMNLALSRDLSKLKNATVIFDSLSAMVDYSDLGLVIDFIRTIKVKISQSGHTVFFIIDSNAHDRNQLNYLLSAMDGEIETITETSKKGETERLVSIKRLKGFKIRPGYHQFR